MDTTKIGVYRKFTVTRTDGKDGPFEKHHDCDYFVLDLNCDAFAIHAMIAYAEACKEKYPELAKDILRRVE